MGPTFGGGGGGAAVVFFGQALDLIGIEDAIGAGIGEAAFLSVFALLLDGAVFDNGCGLFALADLAADFLRDVLAQIAQISR